MEKKPYAFKTVEEALNGECGRTFWASIRKAVLDVGDKESLFARHLDEDLTFDIGNNGILMNLNLKGTIMNFISYGETYPFDHDMPGVWCQKYFNCSPNLSYKIGIGSKTYTLDDLVGEYKMSLLGNVLPMTEFFIDDRLNIKLITFAPISADGASRPRAGIYGLYIKNVSKQKIKGAIHPPTADHRINIAAADGIEVKPQMEYEIGPGKVYWLPLIIAAVPSEDTIKEISSKSSLEWLRSTLAYFRSLTGDLDMPQDVYAGEFLERCIHQCFNATVMDPKGEIAGENSWGSYPLRDEMWMKDFHYSFLPLVMTDPDLARRGILWFLKWSVRYKGRFAGGIEHSMANSLAPVAMAGQYYACTGDRKFFTDNPDAIKRLKWLMDGALKFKVRNTSLLDSKFISDGGSAGDFHTGSNIFAWYCLTSFARVIEEVYDEPQTAARYRKTADGIKKDLVKHNSIDGPFGRQYIEGVNRDGSLPTTRELARGVEGLRTIPYMGHDGEESDTTLASFYGYTTYDDPALQNHKKLVLSKHNVIYSEDLGGVLWGDMGAYSTTFPAYISGLAAASDAETMSGPNGYLTRIRRLTDLDGSIWWWPYAQWKTTYRIKEHAARGLGKCGWASGVFCCLFISQVLGLSYDAPTRTLSFQPFSPSSDFTWDGFRLGKSVFTAKFARKDSSVLLAITNQNSHPVAVRYQAILPKGKTMKSITLGGKPYNGKMDTGTFFESKVMIVEAKLNAGETKVLQVKF